MFFENDFLNVSIIDVLKIQQGECKIYNYDRNFNALSFRFHADTLIKTDGKTHNLTDNCITFFPAEKNYQRITKKDDMIVVHFSMPDKQFNDIEFFYPKQTVEIGSLFNELYRCWCEKKSGYKFLSACIFYEILAKVYAENNQMAKNSTSAKIEPSIDYLMKNYTKVDLSTKELAQKSFVSEVYFRKLFKKEFKMSPKQFIIDLRIKHAEKLISTGYYTLQEVAYRSGFLDYKYFSVEFKKKTGVSPSKYTH